MAIIAGTEVGGEVGGGGGGVGRVEKCAGGGGGGGLTRQKVKNPRVFKLV